MWRISRINEFKEEYPEQEHLKVGYFEEMKQGQEDVEALLSRKVLTSTMLENMEKLLHHPKKLKGPHRLVLTSLVTKLKILIQVMMKGE